MTLDDLPLFQEPKPSSHQAKLERAWKECRRANPWVLPRMAQIALEMKRAGHKRWSINGVFEVFRWQTRHDMNDLGFKANNNHRAYAARDLMREYPELDGFFSTRELKPRPNNWGQVH